jgi:uncharacterized protein (DUF362 family)
MRLVPVVHFTDQTDYGVPLPYHPPERYPELAFLGQATCPGNRVYAGVRKMLRALGYDKERLGTPDWSPLSDLVRPGERVVLKPNFVRHYSENPEGTLESVVTHPSVLRPLLDYALKAVGPSGSVLVADAPQYDCEIETLLERIHLPELLAWYRKEAGRDVEWRDLRVQFGRHENGIVLERRDLPGDPEGYETVDLGPASRFAELPAAPLRVLRGADYDEEVTIRHHSNGRNEYLVSKTLLNADLVLNVAKVKTHKKSGITLSMKNLIGINGDKNWLPHYRAGFPSKGGDEFPAADAYSRFRGFGGDLARRLLKRGIGRAVFRRIRALENAAGLGERSRAGNWHGNDTIWRTILDLNRILYLGDRSGAPGRAGRRVLNVYDGIVAGEGPGPMGPDARRVGLLAAGEDPGAADVVVAWILGFDWRRIPVLAHSVGEETDLRITGFRGDPAALPVIWIDEQGVRETRLSEIDLDLRFEPHPGWRGHVERERGERVACAS